MVFKKLSRHIDSNPSTMQFVSKILNFQSLLVLAAIFVSASNALLCTTCLTSADCTYTPQTQECTVDLVALHHGLLVMVNPNLVAPPNNASVFKCYDLDMSYQSPQTGSTVLVFHKGCTLNSTNFCGGWDNTTIINKCTTCNSEDDCNRGQTEGTTTSAASTTPLNNSTTTAASTTAVSNTTTSASLTTSTTTEATTTTSAPANSTTTSATTTVPATTTRPSTSTVTTTTAKAGGVTNLGCLVNWFTIAGYALLHGLIARW